MQHTWQTFGSALYAVSYFLSFIHHHGDMKAVWIALSHIEFITCAQADHIGQAHELEFSTVRDGINARMSHHPGIVAACAILSPALPKGVFMGQYQNNGEVHCITPRHIIAKIKYRDDVHANERNYWPRQTLRQIMLLNFDLVTGPGGQPVAKIYST